MADTKIIVNKHYRNPSDINESVFSNKKKINKYGIGEDEYLREGEIVICNNTDNPGLYIMTESASTVNPGKVINMTGAENIKLSSGYTESSGTGEYNILVPGDTVDKAFGKLSKQVKEALENAMPNVGDGLEITTDEHGVKTLSVLYDDFTIIKNDGGKLQVNLEVIGSGSTGHVYTAGNLIAIDPHTYAISVTGVTPDDYATKGELSSAVTSVLSEIDSRNYATIDEVADAIANAIIEAEANILVSARTDTVRYVESQGFAKEDEVEEVVSAITSAITELQEEIRQIDPSSIELLSTTISSFTETFIGLDGKEHEPGVYMILEFGKPGGTSTFSYSDVSELINMGSVYLTEEEYEELVENDQVDPNVTYYTYEE